MKYTKEKIFNIILGLCLLIFLMYMISQHLITKDKFNNSNIEKRYTIATIINFIPGAKTPPQFQYKFEVNEKEYLGRNPILSELQQKSKEELKSYIEKRYFVYFVFDNPNYSKLLLNNPVQDSFVKSPLNGWLEIPRLR